VDLKAHLFLSETGIKRSFESLAITRHRLPIPRHKSLASLSRRFFIRSRRAFKQYPPLSALRRSDLMQAGAHASNSRASTGLYNELLAHLHAGTPKQRALEAAVKHNSRLNPHPCIQVAASSLCVDTRSRVLLSPPFFLLSTATAHRDGSWKDASAIPAWTIRDIDE
jgi:hypothetical protein